MRVIQVCVLYFFNFLSVLCFFVCFYVILFGFKLMCASKL